MTEQAVAEAGQQRMAFLVEVGAILVSSLDVDATLQRIVHLAVPYLADYCGVDLPGPDGVMRGMSVMQADGAAAERRHEQWPRNGQQDVVARVLANGRTEEYAVLPDQVLASLVCDPDQLQLLRQRGQTAGIVVPLVARGHALGALTLIRLTPTDDACPPLDATLAEELARRAATAIDNARLYAEAQEAIRSRDEFLSVAAHELRTPVTALRGFAQLALRQMKRGTLDPQRGRQVLEEIEEQTANLANLVNQLLEISRLDSGRLAIEYAPTDVVAAVEGAVRATRARATSHVMAIRAPATLLAILDGVRIERVLVNLVDNAIKFSPHGGVIDVGVTVPLPNTVQITVRDHGIGISPEQQERIFDRFYQAHSGGDYWGMGLGLYVSRRIAELHGGVLGVDSPPGGGTRFTLLLPLQGDSGATPDGTGSAAVARHGRT